MYTYARRGFPLSLSWEEVKHYIQEKLEQCKIIDIMKNLAPNRKHSIFNTIYRKMIQINTSDKLIHIQI